MSFHFDPDAMARDLGTRPDAIRIRLGMPTRLLRLIRNAKNFFEIAALSIEFEQESGFNSCGPKFEEGEKEEYLRKRQELFPAYLEEFTTIEAFKGFGQMVVDNESLRINLLDEELRIAAIALDGLMAAELEKADEDLEKLVILQSQIAFFYSKRNLFAKNTSYGVEQKLRRVTTDKVEAANEVFERIRILLQLKGYASQIFGNRSFRNDSHHPWKFLWEDCKTLGDALLLEDQRLDYFVSKDALSSKLADLMNEEMQTIKSFRKALEFAKLFSYRETYSEDEVYRTALRRVAEKAKTEKEVRTIISVWVERKEKSTYDLHHKWSELPSIIIQKWDNLFMEKATVSDNLKVLAELLDTSPYSSETRRIAESRLEKHFGDQIRLVEDEKTIELIEKDAKALSSRLSVSSMGYRKIEELRKKERAAHLENLWNRVLAGDPDEKKILVGLYQVYKNNPEEAKKVLLRLATHYPAEVVDELPLEVTE